MKVKPSLASIVNKQGFLAYDIARSEDVKEILLGIKPTKELLEEGDCEEVLRRYKINVIKKDSVKEDTRTCPICFDTATHTTECEHDYCLECYLNFYRASLPEHRYAVRARRTGLRENVLAVVLH